MRKQDKLITATIILAVLTCACAGIFAYLTANDSKDNKFSIGSCSVEIIEEYTPPSKLEPGTVIPKDVKVKNTGPAECYVRIKAVFTDSDMEKYCTVDWNETDFEYDSGDGYYYYTKPLEMDEITESLFTEITLSESITAAEIKDFDVLVYVEAYQAKGFDDYKTAWKHYQRNSPNN